MVLLALTISFSDLALELIAGAVVGAFTGRAMGRGGFGIVGDLLLGIVGAIALAFVVGYFGIFNIAHYGLTGEIVVAIIGAILLVVITHLVTSRRTVSA
jgi:uncharacterized membrane protein YeaQ/YmgE (transglycosylase-associated protein family)